MISLFYKRLRELEHSDVIIKAILSLKIPAGEATSKAPLGPTLGQYGIPISDFCSQFNKLSADYENGVLLVTRVILFADLGYEIFIDTIDFCYILKKTLAIEKFSPYGKKLLLPNSKKLTKFITSPVLYELCKFKLLVVFNFNEGLVDKLIRSYYKSICSTVRSLGLLIVPRRVLARMAGA